MPDRYDEAAREWLKARKQEDDPHGGLMPRRMFPPDTLRDSLAALLRKTAEEERERCAKVAEERCHRGGSTASVAPAIRKGGE